MPYLNAGYEKFLELNGSHLYVDKTGLIGEVNRFVLSDEKYLCDTRREGFGKSVTASMLSTYYRRTGDANPVLFHRDVTAFNTYQEYMNAYDVVYVDVTELLRECDGDGMDDILACLESSIASELEAMAPDVHRDGSSLDEYFDRVYSATGTAFVFIVDNWDAVYGMRPEPRDCEAFLSFLNRMLAGRGYVALAYMTGTRPMDEYDTFGQLGMFREISTLVGEYRQRYVFFTEDEIKRLFLQANVMYESLYGLALKASCYEYSINGEVLFNPGYSHEFIRRICSGDYTMPIQANTDLKSRIGSPAFMQDSVFMDLLYMREVPFDHEPGTENADPGSIKGVLAYLVQNNFLSYNGNTRTVRIPDDVVKKEYLLALDSLTKDSINAEKEESGRFLRDILSGNSDGVVREIAEVQNRYARLYSEGGVNDLAGVVKTALHYATQRVCHDVSRPTTREGFVDMVYVPFRNVDCEPVFFGLECGASSSADETMSKIERDKYADDIGDYTGEIVYVGICFNPETRTYTCAVRKE